MKSYQNVIKIILLSIAILSFSSCTNSVRAQWRAINKETQARAKESATGLSDNKPLTLEEQVAQIATFDQTLRVEQVRRELKRHERNLERAQLALYDSAQAHLALGLLYLNNQFYQAALAQFEQALALTPTNPLLHYYAGISSGWMSSLSFNAREEYQERARFHLEKASELDPGHADSALALAAFYTEEARDLEQAMFHLRRYKSLRANSPHAALIEANIARQQNNITVARTLYQQVITETQDSNPTLYQQARQGLSSLETRRAM